MLPSTAVRKTRRRSDHEELYDETSSSPSAVATTPTSPTTRASVAFLSRRNLVCIYSVLFSFVIVFTSTLVSAYYDNFKCFAVSGVSFPPVQQYRASVTSDWKTALYWQTSSTLDWRVTFHFQSTLRRGNNSDDERVYYCLAKNGTGDCILKTNNQQGGMRDATHKWNVECHDGEAVTGIFDYRRNFQTISEIWCKFNWPHKEPSGGYYPYYPHCHVRNITEQQYTCYDLNNPHESVHTFLVGIFDDITLYDEYIPSLYKCCRTPPGYYLDYTTCYYKFTHDKYGEHYDGYWLVKCESSFVATGLGKSINPWDGEEHFVWIQCCPFYYVPPSGHIIHKGPNQKLYGGQIGYGGGGGGGYGGGGGGDAYGGGGGGYPAGRSATDGAAGLQLGVNEVPAQATGDQSSGAAFTQAANPFWQQPQQTLPQQ